MRIIRGDVRVVISEKQDSLHYIEIIQEDAERGFKESDEIVAKAVHIRLEETKLLLHKHYNEKPDIQLERANLDKDATILFTRAERVFFQAIQARNRASQLKNLLEKEGVNGQA